MLTKARPRLILALVVSVGIILFGLLSSIVSPVLASNAEYRRCEPGSSCVIGEFLYDDNYVPIATASCQLTSRNEAGTVVIDDQPLTANSDGWYSYPVDTTVLTAGLYRTQLCCTVSAEDLCLDKSFLVGTSFVSGEEVANAVWDEERADHTATGTFGENLQNPSSISIAEIWSYPSRTLTSFGSLVADVWGYVSRTLTGTGLSSGNLATQADVAGVKSEVTNITSTTNTTSVTNQVNQINEKLTETNEILEDLTNEPIIINLIEDAGQNQAVGISDARAVEKKLQRTRQASNLMAAQVKSLKGRLNLMAKTWNTRSTKQLRTELNTIAQDLGADTVAEADSPDSNSFNSQIRWLRQAWEAPVIERLMIEGDRVLAAIKIADLKLNTSGGSANLQAELDAGYGALLEVEKIIGSNQDSADKDTLLAYTRELEDLNNKLTKQDSELDRLYGNLSRYSSQDLRAVLDTIQKKVLEVNLVPSALVVLEGSATQDHPENRGYALRGVIGANRVLLAQSTESPTIQSWLENGSVVFKFLVTNPSKKTRRTVAIRFQLPRELKPEDIIDKSPDITTNYDAAAEALIATGEIELNPEETRVMFVEAQDIWQISDDEIDSYRKQAETLFQPLQNTSYFAQGVTLKADIEVSLDKIAALQAGEKTPEARILAYRQAVLELQGVKEKLENMKTLVSSAGSVNTVFGFVGGVQTLAVWGLIIILIAGFVFLALYMRLLIGMARSAGKKTEPSAIAAKEVKPEVKKVLPPVSAKPGKKKLFSWFVLKLAILSISSAAITSGLAWSIIWLINRPAKLVGQPGDPVYASETGSNLPKAVEASPNPTSVSPADPDEIMIIIPSGARAVNVREKPTAASNVVQKLTAPQVATRIEEFQGWIAVEFELAGKAVAGWVSEELVEIRE